VSTAFNYTMNNPPAYLGAETNSELHCPNLSIP
jgi:hypothetical protein